jgi:hypothetical protein
VARPATDDQPSVRRQQRPTRAAVVESWSMLYELARRLKEEGRSAAEIRRALLEVGANQEEINVLLGSLGFSAQPHTAAPELLTRASRVTSSRWVLALVFALLIGLGVPVVYVVWSVIDAFRTGR